MENLTLAKALMLDLKKENPEAHKRVSLKWYGIINGIKPDSKEGPSIRDFLIELFADYKEDQECSQR